MSSKKWREQAARINQILLLAAMFLLPGQVAPVYVISALMLALWLVEPDLPTRFRAICREPVFWCLQAYFWLLVIGLLWTENIEAGLGMLDRALALVLIAPVLLSVVKPERIATYIGAFLLGIGVSTLLAHYNWLQLHVMTHWPIGIVVNKSPGDTAPIIDRLTYAPILAWAGYLSARQAIVTPGRKRWMYTILFVLITSNLMFSGGRTGVVAFLILMFILGLTYLPLKRTSAALISLVLVSSALAVGYLSSDHLRERIDRGFSELANFDPSPTNSIGLRIGFGINSLRAWSEAPVFGAGTGDFTQTYKQINDRFTPSWTATTNPHNQFLLIAVTSGLIGVIALVFVYFPPSLRKLPFGDGRDDLRIAFAVWMATISLFESYLWRSNTCLMFVFFTAIVWAGTSAQHQQTAKRFN